MAAMAMGPALFQVVGMLPSTAFMLSLYASFSTLVMLLKRAYHELIPEKLEKFIISMFSQYFWRQYKPGTTSATMTFIIDGKWGRQDDNKLFVAAPVYLSIRAAARNNDMLKVGKFRRQKDLLTGMVDGQEVVDEFEGIELTWVFTRHKLTDELSIKVSFAEKYREKIMNDYLSHVVETYNDSLIKEKRGQKLSKMMRGYWVSTAMQHPSTFETLAIDSELKKTIMDDLDRFLASKEFYSRMGRVCKRGYLLYGPPGTGKSSLVAAMANYLKFDVYDLDLNSITSDSELRKAMLSIRSKSITVIEDIDCTPQVHHRSKSKSKSKSNNSKSKSNNSKSDDDTNTTKKTYSFTLSSLLNCIDGLWSSYGEERIVVFTTNHRELLDPALLRPGRMDMHIHLSYCTTQGFRILAHNYLQIKDHTLFEQIDELIQTTNVTPASVAEELMTSDDPDVALRHVLEFLEQKKIENKKIEEEKEKKAQMGEEEEEEEDEEEEETGDHEENGSEENGSEDNEENGSEDNEENGEEYEHEEEEGEDSEDNNLFG